MPTPKRDFLLIDQAAIDARAAELIESREHELAGYDFEHATHEASIAALGDIKWDDVTTKYRGLGRDQMIVMALKDGLDSAEIQKIADLLSLDKHRHELEAVRFETATVQRHYQNALTLLPQGKRRDDAFAAHKTKKAAQANARNAQ